MRKLPGGICWRRQQDSEESTAPSLVSQNLHVRTLSPFQIKVLTLHKIAPKTLGIVNNIAMNDDR
jgi:hypothetical protein